MKYWSDIGAHLRAERIASGWSLQDVSHRTRIPVQTLHDLEENDYSKVPSTAYTKGFLAQYCDLLDVDAAEWLERFEAGDPFADLARLDYLKDSTEVMEEVVPKSIRTPRPVRPGAPLPKTGRKPAPPGPPVAAPRSPGQLQPFVVFTITALMISGGVYAFVRLNDRIEQAGFNNARDELAESPKLFPAPNVVPSRPAPPKRSKALNSPAPAVAEVVSEGAEDAPPRALVIDSPPPRAVIIEE